MLSFWHSIFTICKSSPPSDIVVFAPHEHGRTVMKRNLDYYRTIMKRSPNSRMRQFIEEVGDINVRIVLPISLETRAMSETDYVFCYLSIITPEFMENVLLHLCKLDNVYHLQRRTQMIWDHVFPSGLTFI